MVRLRISVLVLEVEKEEVEEKPEERDEKEEIFGNVSVEVSTEEKKEEPVSENDITSFILSRTVLLDSLILQMRFLLTALFLYHP